MRMETFIRKALRLKAHTVAGVEEDEAASELVVHLERLGTAACAAGHAAWRRPGRDDAASVAPVARSRDAGAPGRAAVRALPDLAPTVWTARGAGAVG